MGGQKTKLVPGEMEENKKCRAAARAMNLKSEKENKKQMPGFISLMENKRAMALQTNGNEDINESALIPKVLLSFS